MAEILQKLFGSATRLKLLRLFLFNPKVTYSVADAAEHAQVDPTDARREVTLFLNIGLIKKSRRSVEGKVARYQLATDFAYVVALQNLLLNTTERSTDLYHRIKNTGTIKLVVIAGIFLGEWEDARLDLFVVGERVGERKLHDQVRKLESELGKEIRYASLSTEDFFYRLSMNDHLVRDIFDFPHKIVYDKLHVGLK